MSCGFGGDSAGSPDSIPALRRSSSRTSLVCDANECPHFPQGCLTSLMFCILPSLARARWKLKDDDYVERIGGGNVRGHENRLPAFHGKLRHFRLGLFGWC